MYSVHIFNLSRRSIFFPKSEVSKTRKRIFSERLPLLIDPKRHTTCHEGNKYIEICRYNAQISRLFLRLFEVAKYCYTECPSLRAIMTVNCISGKGSLTNITIIYV